MWQYGRRKLREIGPRGVFAGWGLSLLKDSLGFAAFFATFESVKAQAYYAFVAKYYGDLRGNPLSPIGLVPNKHLSDEGVDTVIKPHYAIEPTFLMLAGIAASVTQQLVQHPLNLIQSIHYKSLLTHLDSQSQAQIQIPQSRTATLRTSYYAAYRKTYEQCRLLSRRSGGWRKWLYRGFVGNAIKQVPSTSAGLVIFELVRRRYGSEAEAVRIEKDGYDILLT